MLFKSLFSRIALLALLFGTLLASAPFAGVNAAKLAASATFDINSGRIPIIDGDCSDFSDVIPQTFTDANGATGQVFLKFNDAILYACMKGPAGSFVDRFGALYLDPQGDGSTYQFAQKDDYGLDVGILQGALSTKNGTGAGNYTNNTALAGAWDGKAKVDGTTESIEWSVSYGRFGIQDCTLFGIASYHHWMKQVGDDYGWPSNQWYDQPGTWTLARLNTGQCGGQNGRIAYIYRGAAGPASAFYNLLVGAGYSVDLIPLSNVMTTDFIAVTGGRNYDLIVIADDSGDLDQWGAIDIATSTSQVNRIKAAGIPIIGLGEGGYAFFGKLPLFIGWPNGWHGPQDRVNHAPGAPAAYYNGIASDPSILYTAPVNEVGIYLNTVPADVIPIGLEIPDKGHASVIQQGCRLLWGFSGDPTDMAADGKTMFLNAVGYMKVFQCAPETPPPTECKVVKTSNPPGGTAVVPGSVIEYTIEYSNCRLNEARLVDSIPADTIFVPGSASDGVVPGADGSLVWPIPANGNGTKHFKVLVADTQCYNQRTVNNRAGLLLPGEPAVVSNVVSHPVNCPPITLPNNDPPYAEQEIQIHPYPLVTGVASDVSVRLINNSATPQTVRVSFQLSPERFGIGISFSTFDSQVVTIPANGHVILHTSFTPVSSGHYCLQVKIEDANPTQQYNPIYTQRNLDVNEDLRPGQPDTLQFKVANPTNLMTDINLVVNNTCPGWIATVSPATLTNVGPNGSDIRNASLTVTPPNPVTLGSGCHIDVEGWIGDKLIGGIRKLDVPPVHLPTGINPPWLEPEISVDPNPPVAGQPAQICVELQNPRDVARTVTLDYAVADFGAGVAFTLVASKTVVLPPNSNAKYCVNWTPLSSGTLHRCIRVTLKQAGYQDMHSQRNIDIRRIRITDLPQLVIPIKIGNPDGIKHKLELKPIFYGVDPRWKLRWLVDPPPEINPNQVLNLNMGFELGPTLTGSELMQAVPGTDTFGDEQRVDVSVLLDGVEVSGFTIQFEQSKVYLPLVMK